MRPYLRILRGRLCECHKILEVIVNIYMPLRMSFLASLSFISFKVKCCEREKETSVRQIHCATNMGDKHMNIFYHTFLHYINNFTMQKRNGVSFLLLSEYFRHFFLSSREIRDDRII